MFTPSENLTIYRIIQEIITNIYNRGYILPIEYSMLQVMGCWDDLLERRAEMSGDLILSDFAKKSIQSFLQT